jgi:hypothetical protein
MERDKVVERDREVEGEEGRDGKRIGKEGLNERER